MSFEEKMNNILPLYKEGLKGNAFAIQEAELLLEQLRHEYPDQPLAEAYQGSIMILLARDATDPMEKMRHSEKGLQLLDHAAAAAPQDPMIRLLRGKVAYALPEQYFSRTRTAIEDYTFLLEQKSSEEGTLRDEEYAKLTYELGEAYSRIGRYREAARHWTTLALQTEDAEWKALLEEKLQDLKGKLAVQESRTGPRTGSILFGTAVRIIGLTLQKWAEEERKKEARRKRRKKKS